MDGDIIRPKNLAAKEAAAADAAKMDAANAAAQEEMIQAYAAYLEEVKASNPAEYKRIVDEMMSAAPDGLKAKMQRDGLNVPGLSGPLGKDGQRMANAANVPSKEISPLPGFVVKTKDEKRGGRKVFINICQHEDIKNFSKRVQLMEDGSEQEGLSVPCSVGPPRPIKDKAGKPAVVFDVIVNPAVVKEATGDVTGSSRHWLIEIGMDRIDSKYKTSLDRRYKLPKARYVGKVATQRIRLPKSQRSRRWWRRTRESSRRRRKAEEEKEKSPSQNARRVLQVSAVLSRHDGGPPGGRGLWLQTRSKAQSSRTRRRMPMRNREDGSRVRSRRRNCAQPMRKRLGLRHDSSAAASECQASRLATVRALDDDEEGQKVNLARRERPRPVELSAWMVVVRAEGYHAVEVMLPYQFSARCASDAGGGRERRWRHV